MKEKVLHVKLPENDKYRREKVTEDEGIPKPKSLIGGSDVYKKEIGGSNVYQFLSYWYCKIKNGRDEFMYLYMEDLTEEDLLYDSKTGRKREFSTNSQKEFEENVLEALANKPKEGYRWLPVFEPSYNEKDELQFVIGEKPLVGRLNCLEWDKKLKEYSPENESCMSSKTTYFLLLLRWLKDDIATLEQLVEHSEEIGHYRNSENAKPNFEITGKRTFGGLYGFAGNTGKIVKAESSYSRLGGCYYDYGKMSSLAEDWHIKNPNGKSNSSVGLLELKK